MSGSTRFLFGVVLLSATQVSMLFGQAQEARLYTHLLDGYSLHIRPAINHSHSVNVDVNIDVQNIVQLNERTKVLVLELFLSQKWTDVRLRWRPAEYGGIKKMMISADAVWVPDLTLYNAAGTMPTPRGSAHVVVNSTGVVTYVPHLTTHSYCDVDLSEFPYDTQTCSLKFGSWSHDGFLLNPILEGGRERTNVALPFNNEWNIQGGDLTRYTKRYPCCDEPYPEISLRIAMERKSSFGRFTVLYPAVLLSLITCVVFVLPPGSQEKITLGIIIFAGYLILMNDLLSFLPEDTPHMPSLGKYFTFSMFMAALSLLLSAWVLNMEHRSPRVGRMNSVLRKILLGKLSHVLCLGTSNKQLLSGDYHSQYEIFQDINIAEDDGEEAVSDRRLLVLLLNDIRRRSYNANHGISSRVLTEWRFGALVLDRLFLVIYIIAVVIGALTTLLRT